MDEILIKYVIGEASMAEEELVARWRKESESNEKQLADIKLIWETSKTLQEESTIDADTSWQEFLQLREQSKGDTSHNNNKAHDKNDQHQMGQDQYGHQIKPVRNTRWIQMAAVWIIIAGTGLLLFNRFYGGKPEMLTLQSYDTVKIDTLSDGSVITLNKNSVIRYPEKFTGSTREMQLLSGEAFFSIKHNREKPFIVQVNDASVKVLGTSFNIKNDQLKAQVIVETGIVEVSRKKVVVRLVPAEKVDIDYRTGRFKKGKTEDQFYNYYRTKEFVAVKTPLWRVVEVLNEVYKVDIRVPDRELASRKLTTKLRLGSLDPILDVIALSFNAKIVHESDQIIITGR